MLEVSIAFDLIRSREVFTKDLMLSFLKVWESEEV